MHILLIDKNHPILEELLLSKDHTLTQGYTWKKEKILEQIHQFDGIVIRSRIPIDSDFLQKSNHLKFIARVGAGMENIDVDTANTLGIHLISAPEGNRNAVGEHALGMLLALFNKILLADKSVKNGQWLREEHRGLEIEGKTVGLIGFGNMGQAFAKVLRGLDCKVIFYDIQKINHNTAAEQVSLEELQKYSDVVSLHTPLNALSEYMIDSQFIEQMAKPFYLINTARGKCVDTKSLVKGLKSKKIKGAGLDVLEFEKASFEKLNTTNPELEYLKNTPSVILTPHVAGWTVESNIKLAQTIANKINQI